MPAEAWVAPPPGRRGSRTIGRSPRSASACATAQPMIPAPTIRMEESDIRRSDAAGTGVPASLEARQRDVERADAVIRAVPLDEDRALVASIGDDAAAFALADTQAHGALPPQEAPRRHRNRAREH